MRQTKRNETKRNQAAERVVLHPRRLARSIAKAQGVCTPKTWREVNLAPNQGRKDQHSVPHRIMA